MSNIRDHPIYQDVVDVLITRSIKFKVGQFMIIIDNGDVLVSSDVSWTYWHRVTRTKMIIRSELELTIALHTFYEPPN